MATKVPAIKVPNSIELIIPTLQALQRLGGSGTNVEILSEIINAMNLSENVVDKLHKGGGTELDYQARWARTYLKNSGLVVNNSKAVWSIVPEKNREISDLDVKAIIAKAKSKGSTAKTTTSKKPKGDSSDSQTSDPEEWRSHLHDVLLRMDPFAFERLAQRVLRECGFIKVEVTKKTGDGGIDGTGKLKINGIFSFNVAFQCKRYKDQVGSPEIQAFRGSLKHGIEKGIFITTGTFSSTAKIEACDPAKQQIDLIDGEDLIDKLVQYKIGVKEVTTYEVDDEFFNNL